jgi:sterol desaturase/sphingolipid hydroxylase (fatty acid hydroxylase superfamily)
MLPEWGPPHGCRLDGRAYHADTSSVVRGRSRLDERFARWFGDDQPTHLGSGWFSGTASVFFGAIGLGAVICLHYPALLTQVDLRARYPMPVVRALIQIVIGAGFLFGLLAALLRARKTLAVTGLTLSLAALLAGGADVPIDGPLDGRLYLGLDWFLLNLLLLATIFVPLERLFTLRQGQEVFRPGWTTDTVHFLVSHLLVQVTTLLTVMPATVLAEVAGGGWLHQVVRWQPLVLQFVEVVIVADLGEYTIHRLFHAVPALWRFHQIHHSSVALDWIAGSRLHLVDVIITRAFTLVPIVLLGFAPAAVYAYLVFVSFHAVFIHANVRFRGGWLERVLVMPRFHHWHHSAAPEAVDTNFAVHMPWIDRLFGTYHMPEDRWPEEYGIAGDPVPEGYLAQLVEPFRRTQPPSRDDAKPR